jgi:hypothetical protein
MQSIDLLLVGREGNGKSSVGNSILREKLFNNKSSLCSSQIADTPPMKGSTLIGGRTVCVVDGVSVRDDSMDKKENVGAMINQAETAVGLSTNGFTAFLVVLQYGTRFTQQEKTALCMIRFLFGDDVLKNYGILVMTHGDQFENNAEEEEGITFGDWCGGQSGDFRELFRECGGRCVLFNNRANNIEQVRTLLHKIAELPKGGRYTMDNLNDRHAGPGAPRVIFESGSLIECLTNSQLYCAECQLKTDII